MSKIKRFLWDILTALTLISGVVSIRIGVIDPANTDAFYGGAVLCAFALIFSLASCLDQRAGLLRPPFYEILKWCVTYKINREFKDWRIEIIEYPCNPRIKKVDM